MQTWRVGDKWELAECVHCGAVAQRCDLFARPGLL